VVPLPFDIIWRWHTYLYLLKASFLFLVDGAICRLFGIQVVTRTKWYSNLTGYNRQHFDFFNEGIQLKVISLFELDLRYSLVKHFALGSRHSELERGGLAGAISALSDIDQSLS